MSDKSPDHAGASDPTQEQAESAYEGRPAPSEEEAPSGTRTGRGAVPRTGGGAAPATSDREADTDRRPAPSGGSSNPKPNA